MSLGIGGTSVITSTDWLSNASVNAAQGERVFSAHIIGTSTGTVKFYDSGNGVGAAGTLVASLIGSGTKYFGDTKGMLFPRGCYVYVSDGVTSVAVSHVKEFA